MDESMHTQDPTQYRIGSWQVDGGSNRLLREGEERYLRHKAMALLLLLARHAGQTVSRETIVQAIWDGNDYIAGKAINNAIWSIRQALDDKAETPAYLETIPKKGYRLIAEVQPLPAALPSAKPVRPRKSLLLAGLMVLVACAAGLFFTYFPRTVPATAFGQPEPLTDSPGLEYLGQLSPDGGLLAYAWWRGTGTGHLYLRPARDKAAPPRDISGDSSEITSLSWAPDGQAIAYVGIEPDQGCTLWIYSLRTAARRALTECLPMWTPTLAWSPDGRWLAFSGRDANTPGGLFLIAPDGSGRRQLTYGASPSYVDHQPAWSPDGQRLAFTRIAPEDRTRDLYETDLAGRVKRLTSERLHTSHGLSYARNGLDLIYSTTRQGARALLLWDRNAGTSRPLGLDGSAPALGPDGSLVYALMRRHQSIGEIGLNTAEPSLSPRVRSLGSDYAPNYSEARAQLAFVSARSGHRELWLTETDGSERALTALRGVSDAPAWAPDGQHIAFLGSCGPDGRYGLCLSHVDTGKVLALATDGQLYSAPSWAPDGQHVWVASNRDGEWKLWRYARAGGEPQAQATREPAGQVLAASDGTLYYQPRLADHINRLDPATGQETTLPPLSNGHSAVSWTLHPQGLLLLTRNERERLELMDPANGQSRVLGDYPLGTFAEFARLDIAGEKLYIELADTSFSDLMMVR